MGPSLPVPPSDCKGDGDGRTVERATRSFDTVNEDLIRAELALTDYLLLAADVSRSNVVGVDSCAIVTNELQRGGQ